MHQDLCVGSCNAQGLGGLGDPELMAQMMNSPIMQSVMNDPELLRNMISQNSMVSQVICHVIIINFILLCNVQPDMRLCTGLCCGCVICESLYLALSCSLHPGLLISMCLSTDHGKEP